MYKPLPRTAVLDVSCVDGFALAAPAINGPGDNEVRGAVCVGVVGGTDNDSNTDIVIVIVIIIIDNMVK